MKYIWQEIRVLMKVRWFRYYVLAYTAVLSMLIMSYFTVLSSHLESNLTSKLEIEQAPFTGTVKPIDNIPNYIAKSLDPKIYSTAYLGNYLSFHDHVLSPSVEGRGSHAGVDIIADKGSPVHAIANGVVYKVKNLKYGFGRHIVIKHPKVPLSNKDTALFSSYNHLSKINVREGDFVKKGQVIGNVGDTGFATVPHLHFQLDREEAPFYPYWPFTSKEIKSAGLSVADAVSTGFGKENAKRYTTNPMIFSQSHNYGIKTGLATATVTDVKLPEVKKAVVASSISKIQKIKTSVVRKQPVIKKPNTTKEKLVQQVPTKQAPVKKNTNHNARGKIEFKFQNVAREFKLNKVNSLTIEADKNGRVLADLPKDLKVVLLDSNDKGDVTPSIALSRHFKDGKLDIRYIPHSKGEALLTVSDGKNIFQSKAINIVDADSVVNVKTHARKSQIFSDVASNNRNFKAIKYFRDHQILKGYSDGSFKPNKVITRVEALKVLYMTFGIYANKKSDTNFSDVAGNTWYFPYVADARARGVLKGYSDGSFKPNNIINRVEALKIAFKISKTNPGKAQKNFQDVPSDSWFASYVSTALKKNLLTIGGRRFSPQRGMTRAEFVELLYRLKKTKERGASFYTA